MTTTWSVPSASFSLLRTPSTTSEISTPFASSSTASARALFALGDEYGDDATHEVALMLQRLYDVGFFKAMASEYSVFDRILGGVCWLLQRLVKREDAIRGRVQWEVLFQAHEKMKPRLGLAQEIVRCVDMLPFPSPQRLQPHQLLLQDFGDVGAVRRLVQWLVDVQQELNHLEIIHNTKDYLNVLTPQVPETSSPLKREVVYLQKAYQPRRRYQYTTSDDDAHASEDALIQKCLLEYGERVAVATVVEGETQDQEGEGGVAIESGDPHKSLMAQLAAASAASAVRRNEGSSTSTDSRTKQRTKSKDTREFEAQYQRILQQAMVEQTALLEKQRAREAHLLQQVVSVPETPNDEGDKVSRSEFSTELKAEQNKLQDHQVRLATLEDIKQRQQSQRETLEAEELVMAEAMEGLRAQMEQLETDELVNVVGQPFLPRLRELVAKNEALKNEKSEFKSKCKVELEALQARVVQLRQQNEQEAAHQDEETLRLNEIEQMHTQMSAKHKDMRVALARQTRELQKRMKQIDDVPTRIELIQYEKRFLELYDEVALTLDETRKYYNVYNTLKTTHEFLEKEISLINSMHDNFEVAMGSKPATQAYFSQLDTIIQNVETSVRKQQTLRAEHQVRVETLDSKYQLLLEKERLYVNAIREFQKECEKNEKLNAKLAQYQRQTPQEEATTTSGVSSDDVVI